MQDLSLHILDIAENAIRAGGSKIVIGILEDESNTREDYKHFGPPFILNVEKLFSKIRNLNYRYLPDGTLFPIEITQYGLGDLPLAGERLKQIVIQIVRGVRLPEIYDFDTDVPFVIRERLNRLCKGMANLNHEKRICDFQVVFREIDRCIEILQNRTKYEKWIELRKLWNRRRKQRIEEKQSK